MSKTTSKQPSLKSIEKDCSTLDLKKHDRTLIVTSPYPSAMITSAILSRAIIRSGKRFQITFSQPVLTIDRLNDIRQKYDASALILVGLDLFGTARIKKGTSYPIIIGGELESEQAESLRLGTDLTLAAVAFTLSKNSIEHTDYDLQLAAIGALLSSDIEEMTRNASSEIIDLAKSANLVEVRKGFKLLGVSMLPLDEVFLYSIRPYLKGISGNQKACDSLLNEADIPVPKLRTPLSNLSTSEAQQLTSKLIPRINSAILPQLLGTDFDFLKERDSSPFRHLSGIEITGLNAWAMNELGSFMSILLGDRGRASRLLIDSHMSHSRDVISTLQQLESGVTSESTTSATLFKIKDAKIESLPDIGRIALEVGFADTDRPVAFDCEDMFTVVWSTRNLSMKQVFRKMLSEHIEPVTTSPQSIRILGEVEHKERALRIVAEMNKEIVQK